MFQELGYYVSLLVSFLGFTGILPSDLGYRLVAVIIGPHPIDTALQSLEQEDNLLP